MEAAGPYGGMPLAGVARWSSLISSVPFPSLTTLSMPTITVLLVDDDESLRQLAGSFLAMANFRVVEAVDGNDALRLLAETESEIDVVVTDYRMPRLDGLELRDRLRTVYPSMPIVMISADADLLAQTHSDLIMLRKPFAASSLISKIREVLGLKPAGHG